MTSDACVDGTFGFTFDSSFMCLDLNEIDQIDIYGSYSNSKSNSILNLIVDYCN